MPNHVTNEIIFRNIGEIRQGDILGKLVNPKGEVDFEILIPLPINIWWGSVSTRHEKAFKRTALDWARENWGTKWNAYQHRPVERTDDTLILRFDTAWSPPYPWFAAIFNYFKISYEYNYFNEGEDISKHGAFDWSKIDVFGGDPWTDGDADEATHKHMHVLKYGCESFPEEEAAE